MFSSPLATLRPSAAHTPHCAHAPTQPFLPEVVVAAPEKPKPKKAEKPKPTKSPYDLSRAAVVKHSNALTAKLRQVRSLEHDIKNLTNQQDMQLFEQRRRSLEDDLTKTLAKLDNALAMKERATVLPTRSIGISPSPIPSSGVLDRCHSSWTLNRSSP